MIGELFGNYRAVSLLGKGGMGAVYLAEHPGIGRKVAVKVLRQRFSGDPQMTGRFLNEARAANAIRHPNIIEILDSGTTSSGTPYLVMELLEGESLADRLRRTGALPYPVAFELGYQTASALAAAHRKAIIHRDLKPDNLFVVPEETDPTRERIKVLDFGIAKLQAPSAGDPVKTATGMLMGTPVYMSPEQCLGTKEIDHRSDVYSLGVILFEMVCGRPPFYSEGFGALVHMHLNVPPPAPRELVPGLPDAAEQVILTALAKSPEGRFGSMDEMKAAIKAAAEGAFPVRGASSAPTAAPIMHTPHTPAGSRNPATAPLPLHPTTMSNATGEQGQREGRGPARRWPIVLLVAAGVAAGGWFVLEPQLRRTGPGAPGTTAAMPVPTTAAPGGAPGAEPVAVEPARVLLQSRPSVARVVRTSDGATLGTTPFELRAPRDPGGRLEVRVEKDGYQTATHSVSLDGDHPETVVLEPAVAPARRRKRPVKAAPPPQADPEPAKL